MDTFCNERNNSWLRCGSFNTPKNGQQKRKKQKPEKWMKIYSFNNLLLALHQAKLSVYDYIIRIWIAWHNWWLHCCRYWRRGHRHRHRRWLQHPALLKIDAPSKWNSFIADARVVWSLLCARRTRLLGLSVFFSCVLVGVCRMCASTFCCHMDGGSAFSSTSHWISQRKKQCAALQR